MTTRLWGWLSPDQADPLAAKPAADRLLAESLGLDRLQSTPPEMLDPDGVPDSRLTAAQIESLRRAVAGDTLFLDPSRRAAAVLGQSYPDQLARRAGVVSRAADAVIEPADASEVAAVLALAGGSGFRVLATGGGTNVVGAFSTGDDRRPLVALSLKRLNGIIAIEPRDRTVTAQSGVALPALEQRLAAASLTLGHFPQSFQGATLGGSLAGNGAGQRSDGYGRIADNLVSARVATPSGPWSTEAFRHSASGPWIGGLVAGSEGLLGVLVDATLRLHEAPAVIADEAWFVADFAAGLEAARALAQTGSGLAMVRVSDAAETRFLGALRHALAGRSGPGLPERLYLALRRVPRDPCLVIVGAEGDAPHVGQALSAARRRLKAAGGVALGRGPGESWRRGRYHAPYLRESLMARGLGVDTYETSAPWSKADDLRVAVIAALERAGDATGVRLAAFCHLSHSYIEGACLYFTAVFPRASDALGQWRTIKRAATDAIVAHGGTLSHHHGVGGDHAAWARAQKGDRGLALLAALKRELDPANVMATGMEKAFG